MFGTKSSFVCVIPTVNNCLCVFITLETSGRSDSSLLSIETSGRSDSSLLSPCVQEVSRPLDDKGPFGSRSGGQSFQNDPVVFPDGASKIQEAAPSDSTDAGE